MAGKRKRRSVNSQPCLAKRCKREEDTKKRFSLIPKLTDFTLPGFHYLGPGSSKDNGPPTNNIDAIAKQHDEAYDQAVDKFKQTHDLQKSVGEIEKADLQFIETMRKTRATTAKEALGKTVGLVGIGLKAAVEKSLGYTLYPNFTKLTEESNPASENVIKIRAGDDFN